MADISSSILGYFDEVRCEYVAPKKFNTRVRTSFPHSLTDQSYYVPNKRAITGQNVSQSASDSQFYDFPDGKINSSLFDSMVDMRRPGLDIVEKIDLANESISSVQKVVNDDVNRITQEKAKKVLKDKRIEDAVSKVNSSNITSNNTNNNTSN